MVKDHKYVPIKLGWIYSSDMRRPGHINPKYGGPNYRDIANEVRAGDYLLTIEDNCVRLSGIPIARAPDHYNNTKKIKFLKSVVWGLINDPGALKDKIGEYLQVPEEAPAYKVPAPIRSGPCSVYGWTKLGSCSIREEAISCN